MPRPLMFAKRYFDDLVSGRKLATVRAGRARYKPGDVVLVHCGGYVLGRVRIVSVEKKKVVDLTEEDARLDGFSSLRDLLAALKQHYPAIRANTPLTILRFEWVERFETPVSSDEYGWRYEQSPQEVAELALRELSDLSEEEKLVLGAYLRTGSIRKAAARLGGLSARPIVRGVLRRAAERLAELGLVRRKDAARDTAIAISPQEARG